jgi:hypothetical protein
MSLKAWNDIMSISDYHYVRLTFQTCDEVTNSPDVRFAIYDPNISSWVPITSMSNPELFNTNHFITENAPIDTTAGSATVFLTWQATDSPQTPSHALIQSTYNTVLVGSVNCASPLPFYFPVYWNEISNSWAINDVSDVIFADPFVDNQIVPCFSENTMMKLLRNVTPRIPVVLVKSIRWDKKMYRVNHPIVGELEFTDDHPFIYNNKVYQFKELLDIHPNFKQYSEVDKYEPKNGMHNYVYNFMIDPDNQKLDATIKLDNNLSVMGLVPFEHFGRKLQKKLEIMCVLMNNQIIDLSGHMSNDVSKFIKGERNHYIYLNS